MDLLSILGLAFGVCIVLFGILFDSGTGVFIMANLKNFWDPTSVGVVFGGVLSALMVSFPISSFTKIPKHLKIIFFPTKYNPKEYIARIVELATEARINGLLSLESKLEETKDAFLKSSMMLVVDAVDPEKVKNLLETELEYLDERHAQDRAFYEKASAYSPAFGMIGTLMGLINLMKKLDDPNAIAPAMALALVTTFYGSVLANMVFTPISNKLKVRHEEEYLCKMIIVEGVQSIQAGDNPRFIEEKLTQLIPGFLMKKGLPGAEAAVEEAGGKKGKRGKK
ncbi:MAG: chemotaxis protein MotA [Clostridiales bacterium]|jgi:chemotaxis protein MotA|nr:chemotaxis protein MotA [Clostridiales bacterium]